MQKVGIRGTLARAGRCAALALRTALENGSVLAEITSGQVIRKYCNTKMQETVRQDYLFSKMGSILAIFTYRTNSGPTRLELGAIHTGARPAENGN